MGMDLIVAVAHQRHPQRTGEELRNLVNELDAERANSIFEHAFSIDFDEVYDDPDNDDVVETIQAHLLEAIAVLESETYHRSVMVILDLDDRAIAIGGGNSWGDTPEGFDLVNVLDAWGEW